MHLLFQGSVHRKSRMDIWAFWVRIFHKLQEVLWGSGTFRTPLRVTLDWQLVSRSLLPETSLLQKGTSVSDVLMQGHCRRKFSKVQVCVYSFWDPKIQRPQDIRIVSLASSWPFDWQVEYVFHHVEKKYWLTFSCMVTALCSHRINIKLPKCCFLHNNVLRTYDTNHTLTRL